MNKSANILRNAILIPIFLFQACIPSLSKGFLQSVTDFIQLRSLVNPASTGPYYVSVSVSGLLGTGLVLDLNSGTESIVVNADGSFDFKTALSTGNNFNVTVNTQPTLPTQTCSVSGGMGVVAYGNINSIIVNCDPLRYTVGGTITGLDGITGLVLTNSVDGSTLNVAVASGSFAFTQTYLDGTTYNVSVTTQPNHPVQNCLTTNGSGTISGANVTDIIIACNSTAFPIEVTAVGIASGTLSIRNNNSELLTISTNGLHRFPTNIITNNTYSLQIVGTPANHQCVLSASGGTVTGTISITANCFSVLSFNPSNGGVLQPTESLRLQFSDEVNAGSCITSTGTLNTVLSIPIQFSVTTTTITNDTLIVSPAATDSWITGHRVLTLNCFNVGGTPLSSTVNILYLVPSAIRYVSASGLDTNPGTDVAPKRNIQAAIDDFLGCASGDCAVLVEDGSYDPTFSGGAIHLVSGISLYGGYQPTTSFGVWRPNLHGSVILMDTTPAGCSIATITSPCASIIGDATVTSNVTISGFRIQSGPDTAPYMAGVFLDSTNNVRLINNDIDGGVGINGVSGVHAINSNPYLIQNVILGGNCTAANCDSVGVYMSTSVPIAPVILVNSISGGTPTGSGVNSRGIRYAGTAAMTVTNIIGNLITSKNLNKTTSLFSIGFDINSGTGLTGTLSGNIITGGAGGTSIGLRIQATTSIQIGSPTQGNQITSSDALTGTYGLYLSGGQTVRRNVIRFGTAMSAAVATAIGIYATGGGTQIIESNSIQDGNVSSTGATATLNGIYSANASATSSITGNYIRIGRSEGTNSTATTTAGISLNTPQNALIANNWIQNGTSDVNARGLEFKSVFSGLRVYHNTVSSGTGTSNETPLFIGAGSASIDIQNNILMLNNNSASTACIYNAGIGLQTAVKYNVLHNCVNLVIQNAQNYSFCAGGVPGTLVCTLPLGIPANFGNNLNIDPELASNFGVIANYTPTTATSCLITKSTNALLTDSYNGIGTRPGVDGAISLGAVEYDQACTP
ncbi:hypothetical protein EHQ16_08520 [Leptospira kanakyensis]|uniref:DUF1565 domain-containing protein n=1 Tax=Leptospira kanakyensis TaxID=2484968 RepID=A0A6N4Q8X0_9LEPT|nr:hypothetical protein [Leptospira kanakyensis]TGK55393.1 hypothetical protein EHQ11_00695 [Leptospira kanakyensis]TGK60927.1 hypothetical protein EHQ16_08520 [Leptospira kanakyensis]TGK76599.1 hypothetical protein EHQ18_01130 [Leptospira kanakyensis]